MDARLKRILPKVQKPARYVGGEYNQTIKDLVPAWTLGSLFASRIHMR